MVELLTQRKKELKGQLATATANLKAMEANVNRILGAMTECSHQLVLANTLALTDESEGPKDLKGES